LLGYPSQALQRSHEAITLARELSHAYSLVLALTWGAECHQYRREGQAAQERAEAAIAFATEQGFAEYLARGTILRGWALAEQGQGETAIAQMRQGLAALQATGTETHQFYYLALLAKAYGAGAQAEEGLTVLAEALAALERTGERAHVPELYRIKGELLLNAVCGVQHAELAEECFQQALAVARRQQARSWELRAALSLSRLWQQQGKRDSCWHRSTGGSPRGLTPPTCRRLGRYSMNWCERHTHAPMAVTPLENGDTTMPDNLE
jgi:predicted ATPase